MKSPIHLSLCGAAIALCSLTFSMQAASDNPYGLLDLDRATCASPAWVTPDPIPSPTPAASSPASTSISSKTWRTAWASIRWILSARISPPFCPPSLTASLTPPLPPFASPPAREKTVDFSTGYLSGYLTVLTRNDSGVKNVETQAKRRLGVIQGTL